MGYRPADFSGRPQGRRIPGRHQSIDHCLLDRFDTREIDNVQLFIVDATKRQMRWGELVKRTTIGGAECKKNITRVVATRCAVAANADRATLSQTGELVRQQWNVRPDDDNDRTTISH